MKHRIRLQSGFSHVLILLLFVTIVLVGFSGYMVYVRQKDANTYDASTDTHIDLDRAADCTSIEQYDPVEQACFYECEDDVDCAAKEQQVQQELEGYFVDTTSKSHPIGSSGNQSHVSSESVGRYSLSEGNVTPEFDTQKKREVWQYFLAIAGREFVSANIAELEFTNDPDSDTSASVEPIENTPGMWLLSVNLAHANDTKELVFTMVH